MYGHSWYHEWKELTIHGTMNGIGKEARMKPETSKAEVFAEFTSLFISNAGCEK